MAKVVLLRDPREVEITPVKAGRKITLPAAHGGVERQSAPSDGLHFEAKEGGVFFVSAQRLWEKLDELLDE